MDAYIRVSWRRHNMKGLSKQRSKQQTLKKVHKTAMLDFQPVCCEKNKALVSISARRINAARVYI